MNSPILFLIFNRPDTTEKVFEEIRKAQPPKLYIAADGPRENRSGEKELCDQTRLIVTKVDWECEVKTLFRDQNLGCGKAVSKAITWFFENELEGIIIEDDILPHPDFFPYCDELLERYRNTPQVGIISGRNHLYTSLKRQASYGFLYYPHIWGWATWRTTWQKYHFEVNQIRWSKINKNLKHYGITPSSRRFWHFIYNQMRRKQIDTWDYQLSFSVIHHQLLTVMPYRNLTKNIGFDQRATHTTLADQREINLATQSIMPLTHPVEITTDSESIGIDAMECGLNLSRLALIKSDIRYILTLLHII